MNDDYQPDEGALLVLNAGSSTLKYEFFGYTKGQPLIRREAGVIEGIGEAGAEVASHEEALRQVLDQPERATTRGSLLGVAHRVVHGGEEFSRATLIDASVLEGIRQAIPLAPLHNPANLAGIEACRLGWPGLPQVAVFDTAFHQTIPEAASHYGLGLSPEGQPKIRRYGFHGTSYASVCRRLSAQWALPVEALNLIVLHLGNGASACAIQGGRSLDTSMGMTPTAGLVMGTRSGDLDPGIVLHWLRHEGCSVDDIDRRINREGGLKGLSGHQDMRKLLAALDQGEDRAELALGVFVHRIRHYLGAYRAALPELTALVFTGGIGEHAPLVRARILDRLVHLGFELDALRNAATPEGLSAIHKVGAKIPILVMPAAEEHEMACQMCELIGLSPLDLADGAP